MNENRKMAEAVVRPLNELPPEERPRERLFACGPEQLTDAELLGIIFGTGIRGATAVDLGRHLVSRYGGLRGLARPGPAELRAQRGIGTARAARLAASIELGRRFAAAPLVQGIRIDGTDAVRRHFGPLLADIPRERLYAVLLDRRNRVIREHLVAEGTIGEAAVHPREVFLPAIREFASALIIVHNHPSGDPTPSESDYSITVRLVMAGKILGIPVLDHMIVAGRESVSFAELHGGSIDSLCPELRLLDTVGERGVEYHALAAGTVLPRRDGVIALTVATANDSIPPCFLGPIGGLR